MILPKCSAVLFLPRMISHNTIRCLVFTSVYKGCHWHYLFGYIMLGARPMGIIFFSLRLSVVGKKVNYQSHKKLHSLKPLTYLPTICLKNELFPRKLSGEDAFKNNLLYQREGQCNSKKTVIKAAEIPPHL